MASLFMSICDNNKKEYNFYVHTNKQQLNSVKYFKYLLFCYKKYLLCNTSFFMFELRIYQYI